MYEEEFLEILVSAEIRDWLQINDYVIILALYYAMLGYDQRELEKI